MSAFCRSWQLLKDPVLASSSIFLVPAVYVTLHYFHQLLKNLGSVSNRVWFFLLKHGRLNTKEILSPFWSLFQDVSPKFLERVFLI